MTDLELVDRLRLVAPFASLRADDLRMLADALLVEDHPDGHVFIRQGERGATLFLLLDGEVRVTGHRAGHATEHELNRLHPGELFGLVGLVDHAPRSATCRAVGPCRSAALDRVAASLLFHHAAPIACAFQRALLVQLARDFRHLDGQLRRMMKHPPSA